MEVDAEDDPLNERVRRQRSISVGSETDVVNETGNYHLLSPVEARYHPGDGRIEGQQQRWDLNYHEAAIYIHEGENNDKFTAHPNRHDELPWYLITHSTWFYLLDVFAAMLLMLLALVEQPAVHSTLELFGLLLIGLELGMRLKWLGTRAYLHHTRTMIKTVVLVIMAVEVIVVFIRQSQHFRVTRAIRPIFLLDSYYCRGTRRFIRQIIQSLPPILDMFTLLLFFMLMFSILGFYLFSDIPNDTFLAVVYDSFLKMEKEKLKKLMLHKRVACQHCFRLLASKQNPTMITLKHFCGLMKYYKPTLTLHKGVTSKWFDGVIFVRSRVNVHQAVIIENEYQYIWVAVIFVAIYIVEIVLKILALGPHGYFSCGWNRFDFLVVLVSAIGLLLELADRNFYYLLVLRPLRLLRLFKMKRRLRDILGTIMMLFSRMVSIAIVMLLLYYSFAIIGIELFSRYNLKDSCINGSVEVYYRYTNGTDTGYYYLNSFENILISCVTLFELTVVNNWYIIMVVMTVVVAFILEAFLFRIQYRDKMHGLDMEDDAMFKVDVALSPDELFMCHSIASPLSNAHILQQDWIAEEADRHHREAQELRLRQRHLMDSHVSERSRVT
ncbi:hypothetical protein NP493_477g01020 [Ridgeia piscesae]|uniref:Ion transport domain-containing protein n=1 Tax=Ridgeia piscesae TaxID=27915 RepID=A0AAD9KYH8_RIDPI|nr:hypothetical protein NP493_477g01020 [Ridgeia piscesae]